MKSINNDKTDMVISYVPHGINPEIYKPLPVPVDFKTKIFGDKKYKFVIFWMNRNIKRKQPSDVIWAYSKFGDMLPEKDKDSICLLMHTNPVDENGTDLPAVKNCICPDYDIIFSTSRMNQENLNHLYNLSDITINIAGNEGFGLTTAESIMTETPTIQTVTGGLQDQCGFKRDIAGENETENWVEFTADDYKEIGTLHDYRKWEHKVKHGDWVKPVWPRVRTMVGSVPTPYIIDDKVDVTEVADAIKYWYDKTPADRKKRGKIGRKWMLNEGGLHSDNMCKTMADSIELTLKTWKPKKRWEIYKINQ